MHFALSCVIRAIAAGMCAAVGWYFYNLPVGTAFSIGQAIFFISFAAVQPNWRSLLGEPYLMQAASEIPEEDKRVRCGGGPIEACAPLVKDAHRKAIELDFCLKRVKSRVIRMEEEMWRRSLLVSAVSFGTLIFPKLQSNGIVAVSTAQTLELITPIMLLFLTIGLAYAEISTQRNINLSAAGL